MTSEGTRLAVIVEDDPDVRNLLRTILTQSGFETVLTSNGEDGVEAVRLYNPILTTLDVSMPGMDGVAAAARIREFSNTYILMVTAQAEEIDIIQGLDAGADEYIVKPFRPRELRARVASLLRRPRDLRGASGASPAPDQQAQEAPATPTVWRRHQQAQPYPQHPQHPQPPHPAHAPPPQLQPEPEQSRTADQPPPEPARSAPPATPTAPTSEQPGHAGSTSQVIHRGLVLDPSSRTVTADGSTLHLEPREFDLLASLMTSGRRVRSKADLVLTARGESFVTTYYVREADKRDIDLAVEELRRKLGDTGEPARWIETVRGVGYRMTS